MEFAGTPRRFKLTIGSHELQFNHRIIFDSIFINCRPILHMVDESTIFCAAAFFRIQSENEISRNISSLWGYIYIVPPDLLSVDQRFSYISKEMRETLSASEVTLEETPIETPWSIKSLERYHAPLRRAYNDFELRCERTNLQTPNASK